MALAKIDDKKIEFLSSCIVTTTGIKGTKKNINGLFKSLKKSLDKVGFKIENLDEIRLMRQLP